MMADAFRGRERPVPQPAGEDSKKHAAIFTDARGVVKTLRCKGSNDEQEMGHHTVMMCSERS